MLPQFGYIVAQAGADSHPQGGTGAATVTINNNKNTNLGQSSNLNNSSQLTKPYLPQQQQTNNDNYYYTRHSSPSSNSMLPPPLPFMYSSGPHHHPPPPQATTSMTTRDDYYGSNRYFPVSDSHSYRPLQPLPPPPPPPPPPHLSSSTTKHWHPNEGSFIEPYHHHPPPPPPPPSSSSSIWHNPPPQPIKKRDEILYEDHRWPQEPIELNENKMLRRIRESNDLMNRMDTEFWEQCDEIYRDKLQSLQEEIRMIQSGTHSAFRQTLADIESKREQTIEYAEYFRNYELSLSKSQYDQEISILQDDYENERHNLHDIVLQAIEEKKKSVREDKEEIFDVKDLFKDAYLKVHSKRNLRKRTPLDRHSSSSPSRQDRRRRDRQATPHNIHATPSTIEEEELETEFIIMKMDQGGNSSRRQTSSQQKR